MIKGSNPIQIWTEKYLNEEYQDQDSEDYVDQTVDLTEDFQRERFEDYLRTEIGEDYAERLIKIIQEGDEAQAYRTAKAYDQNLDFEELGPEVEIPSLEDAPRDREIPQEAHEESIESFREAIKDSTEDRRFN